MFDRLAILFVSPETLNTPSVRVPCNATNSIPCNILSGQVLHQREKSEYLEAADGSSCEKVVLTQGCLTFLQLNDLLACKLREDLWDVSCVSIRGVNACGCEARNSL
mmetsp:Transcript_78566/g.118168  ORF Transcript_78566/g.118168 Transcript_78566/m.118168 type:complete len:107 (+) Transcript_78566:729-1049(+)